MRLNDRLNMATAQAVRIALTSALSCKTRLVWHGREFTLHTTVLLPSDITLHDARTIIPLLATGVPPCLHLYDARTIIPLITSHVLPGLHLANVLAVFGAVVHTNTVVCHTLLVQTGNIPKPVLAIGHFDRSRMLLIQIALGFSKTVLPHIVFDN